MKVRANFYGGPHDGAECEIDAPAPKRAVVRIDGVDAVYEYRGTEHSVALYWVMSASVSASS